jgi:hypothetical protein
MSVFQTHFPPKMARKTQPKKKNTAHKALAAKVSYSLFPRLRSYIQRFANVLCLSIALVQL